MVQYNMSIPSAAFNLMYVEGCASAIMHTSYKVGTLIKYCESTPELMQNKHINLRAFFKHITLGGCISAFKYAQDRRSARAQRVTLWTCIGVVVHTAQIQSYFLLHQVRYPQQVSKSCPLYSDKILALCHCIEM